MCNFIFSKRCNIKQKLSLSGYITFLLFFILSTIISVYGLSISARSHAMSDCKILEHVYTFNNSSMAVCKVKGERRNCFFNNITVGDVRLPDNTTYHCWRNSWKEDYTVSRSVQPNNYIEVSLFALLTTFMITKVIALSLVIYRKCGDYVEYQEL